VIKQYNEAALLGQTKCLMRNHLPHTKSIRKCPTAPTPQKNLRTQKATKFVEKASPVVTAATKNTLRVKANLRPILHKIILKGSVQNRLLLKILRIGNVPKCSGTD
jgi:hypothetical protein